MEVSKEQKKCNDRWTVAEVLGVLSIIALMGGFVQHLVNGTEDRVISAIEKVDTKVQRVDNKIDKHIDFHLLNPLCLEKGVSNEGEVERTQRKKEIAYYEITGKKVARQKEDGI